MFGFDQVVKGLHEGRLYRRAPWPLGSFIFLVKGSTFTVNREPLLSILGVGAQAKYAAHIDIRSSEGIISPWKIDYESVLATDWEDLPGPNEDDSALGHH